MTINTRRPLTFIPEFLPDQTLYSWCSLYHEHSGNARPEYSNQQLFWSSQSGWGFHLTSHLNNFCAATRHIFGSPEDIIKKRTTLPAYLWFRSQATQNEVFTKLKGEITSGVPQKLGIWQPTTGATPPRRLCTQCAKEDIAAHGEAYWHRAAQVLGATSCIQHQIPLLSTDNIANQKHKWHYLTPANDIKNGRLKPLEIQGSKATEASLKLSEIAIGLVENYESIANQLHDFDGLLLKQLIQAGFPCSTDPLSAFIKADREYQNHIRIFGNTLWLTNSASSGSSHLLGKLLLKSTQRPSAIEYALVIQWLFCDSANFLSTVFGPFNKSPSLRNGSLPNEMSQRRT